MAESLQAHSWSAAGLLEVAIGDEAVQRLIQGGGTLCDVVLAAWATDVDPADAVVQYAEAADEPILSGRRTDQCA
ncbi:hypothetical protein [Nocardia sp. CNY236]|uniref:hypothetical protein n=1 Tax=Nocardia sp. CNY236 TaxID=1169152 RepID=UPI0012DEAFEF|nr:hypothetical protein [Nocardia sp. CNY236]